MIHIYKVSKKKLRLTFLLISRLIRNVEKWFNYPQNWHGKSFPTVCDSTFSVDWFSKKLTFYVKF